MMSLRLSLGVTALLLAFAPGLVLAAAPSVVVEIAPAKIERRTFDPRNPPADMPKLTPPEVGTCVYQFGCSTEALARGSRSRLSPRPARVTEITVRATLKVTLWTPVNGPAKILEHEEAHREICEYYYDNAEQIGRRLARRALGRTFPSSSPEELRAELDALQKELIREFLEETATRCDVAQARFDAITNHSMSPIAEDIAITRAIAAEEAMYAHRGRLAPTVAPATEGAAAARRYPPTRPKSRS